MCPEGAKKCENWFKENMIKASNPKNATKQTVAEENFEVSVNCSKMKRLLEELTQLSKELEEEKEKCRRLRKENASLDIELEL